MFVSIRNVFIVVNTFSIIYKKECRLRHSCAERGCFSISYLSRECASLAELFCVIGCNSYYTKKWQEQHTTVTPAISYYFVSPIKNKATVPGPACPPITGPRQLINIFFLPNRLSTSSATNCASSGQSP